METGSYRPPAARVPCGCGRGGHDRDDRLHPGLQGQPPEARRPGARDPSRPTVELDDHLDRPRRRVDRRNTRRSGLTTAIDVLARVEADGLVAKLNRLSRSVADFAGLLRLARTQEWSLVALDLGIDAGTINGRLVANLVMTVGQLGQLFLQPNDVPHLDGAGGPVHAEPAALRLRVRVVVVAHGQQRVRVAGLRCQHDATPGLVDTDGPQLVVPDVRDCRAL